MNTNIPNIINPSQIHIDKLIRNALIEDMPYGHDLTTELTIPDNSQAIALITTRENGILAGLNIALTAFSHINKSLEVTASAQDGKKVKTGDKLAKIKGDAKSILMAERVALNILSHLSGIASTTRQYVDEIEGTNARITCTRKTLPNLRIFQKYAVMCGGGFPHRNGLDDAILIKDNHIAVCGGIHAALDQATNKKSHTKTIEIEVDTLEQLDEVLDHGGADIVMLDNMNENGLKKAVQMIDNQLISEASGGVCLKSVRTIAKTGVNYISVGALTHSSRALDIGLDIDIKS
jgi:nicotinate-nucleotide pyrophosphorylase (carboxylating)